MLLLPVPLKKSAWKPLAMLSLPLVTPSSAPAPIAELSLPDVRKVITFLPSPTLPVPVKVPLNRVPPAAALPFVSSRRCRWWRGPASPRVQARARAW